AGTAAGAYVEAGAERGEDAGQLGGRVCVHDGAADGAARPRLRMADESDRLPQQRPLLGDGVGPLERRLSNERAEEERPVLDADAVEPDDPVEVDEQPWAHEAEVEERHEALAAGERFRIVPGEQLERLLQGLRRRVLERRRLHARCGSRPAPRITVAGSWPRSSSRTTAAFRPGPPVT